MKIKTKTKQYHHFDHFETTRDYPKMPKIASIFCLSSWYFVMKTDTNHRKRHYHTMPDCLIYNISAPWTTREVIWANANLACFSEQCHRSSSYGKLWNIICLCMKHLVFWVPMLVWRVKKKKNAIPPLSPWIRYNNKKEARNWGELKILKEDNKWGIRSLLPSILKKQRYNFHAWWSSILRRNSTIKLLSFSL